MAVALTGMARSAGDRVRTMCMAMMAAVGRNATAPSVAGTVGGIAMFPVYQNVRKPGVPR